MANGSLSLMGAPAQTVMLRTRDLMPHEYVLHPRIEEALRKMEDTGMQPRPIAVTRIGDKFLIIDGHHRAHAIMLLGYPSILATEIGFYFTSMVSVKSWKTNGCYDKATIVRRALAGDLYPPHTTRHVVRFADDDEWRSFHHHKQLESKKMRVPLRKLEREYEFPDPLRQLI